MSNFLQMQILTTFRNRQIILDTHLRVYPLTIPDELWVRLSILRETVPVSCNTEFKKQKEMFGKFINSSLSQKGKWAAIVTVIEPAIIYPFVNIFFSEKEIQPLDSLTSRMKNVALGINKNFPRAILHGSQCLGGMGIPSSSQKNTRDRLNYFLYNIHRDYTIKWKFNISIIYTQLELGSFQQFFSLSVKLYGHLPTISYCVQLWYELEPKGIHLVPTTGNTWFPTPLSTFDHPIMEFAIKAYNQKG